jgi:hypothetical protein
MGGRRRGAERGGGLGPVVGEDGVDDLADAGVERQDSVVLGQVLADVVERAVDQHGLGP